jgi:hypothetical protein
MCSVEHANGGLGAHKSTQDLYEPIAIVGLAFEFPGDIVSEEDFWDILIRGHLHEPSIPEDRFNAKIYASRSDGNGIVSFMSLRKYMSNKDDEAIHERRTLLAPGYCRL